MNCDSCGSELHVGDWPWCPHGRPVHSKGFEPHFDYGLGEYVTGFGDINKHLRPKWQNDYIEHIQPRDLPPNYYKQLNERRRERAEAEKRERR